MTDRVSSPDTIDTGHAESYPTLWAAIPVDPPPPSRQRLRPTPAKDGGPVFLSVEQADVG